MIHGNRQARAALQARTMIVAGAVLVLLVAVALAAGSATVDLAVPWKPIAILVTTALVVGIVKLREHR